tara:strand:- start:1673 stop:2818 length:1146 start_codon:yes stop_codon:yes gene_type:complete
MNTSDLVTLIFLIIILVVPVLLWNKKSKKEIGSIVTTLGLIGTFTGILIGLINFDPINIEDSIPNLLGGLQTAFITSVAGITSGLIIKNLKTKNDLGGANPLESLKLGINTLNITSDKIHQTLENINKGLFNDDKDSSILTQLQKIRTVNSDGLNDLKNSFNEFAQKIVSDNTQSLIDALTDVMKDFNAKINEQFGDNFKELNNSVKELLVWQNNYKDHLEKLQDNFNKISENLTNVDDTVKNISTNHEIIIEANNRLNSLVLDFSEGVGSFSKLGDKASKALPIIESNLESLTTSLDTSYNNFQKTQNEIQEKMKISIENMIANNAERIKSLDENLGIELEKSLETLGSSLATLSNKFVEDYTPLTQKLRELITISKNNK